MQTQSYETSIGERFCQRILVHPTYIDKGARILRAAFEFVAYLLFSLWFRRTPKVRLPPVKKEILLESAADIARKIREKQYTSEEVVSTFIGRIKEINPLLNCVVDQRFEDALTKAKEVDKLLKELKQTVDELERDVPFLGVPFTCKDSIAVKGFRQTIGLVSRKDVVAEEHAVAIAKMVDAGAIPVAVTNVPEVCLWWESVNPLHGRTLNPYDSRRLVGGSSGGEACLLTSCGSPVGVGSDIGGSIRIPAHFNGIYGHKPTFNIVSNKGSLPDLKGELNEFLVLGPMSKRARDLRPTFKVLAGGAGEKKLQLDNKVDIRSLKFYYMEDDGGFPLISPVDGEMRGALLRVVDHLRDHYGVGVEKVHLSKLFHSVEMWSFKISAVEEAPTFCEELADRKGVINPFWELAKFFFGKSNHSFPAIIVGIAEKVAYSQADSKYQRKMIEGCDHLREEFQHLLGDDGVFLYPSYPHAALFHNQAMLMPFGFAYQSIFNVLKFPVTQCPVGLSRDGLPLGVQVVSRLHNDHLTLSVAEALEETLCQWVPPCDVEISET